MPGFKTMADQTGLLVSTVTCHPDFCHPDPAERDRMLVALDGLEGCFYVEVEGARMAARSETRGVQPGRTTAVHYVKYPLSTAAAERLRVGTPAVALGVSHPAYEARTELIEDVVAELRADLTFA